MFEFKTEYVFPAKICECMGAENAEALLIPRELQIDLTENEVCVASGGFIALDFGMEYSGGARILVHRTSSPTVNVRLRFGESLAECYAELGERGAGNDHSPRDFTVPLAFLSDIVFGATGFRFLRIDFPEGETVALKSVVCAYTHRVFPECKPFATSDKLLLDIFNTAKRTVELCCQTLIWDGIKRDRLVWIGDMHPETLALASMYGRMELIERSLGFAAEKYPPTEWMDHMPMYTAWWLIVAADYSFLTGEYGFAARHAQYIQALLEKTDGCIEEDGALNFPSYFVDWPTHEQPDEKGGCRAILLIMADKAAALLEKLGKSTKTAIRMREKLIKTEIDVQSAKQVAALKYLATGKLSDSEKELVLAGGAKGMSTFMSYYILKTIAEISSTERAKEVCREYYGAMLEKGATTFFEDFDIEWAENSSRLDELPREGMRDIHGDFGKYCYTGFRHSFCHGWSAGVIKFLYEYCNEAK